MMNGQGQANPDFHRPQNNAPSGPDMKRPRGADPTDVRMAEAVMSAFRTMQLPESYDPRAWVEIVSSAPGHPPSDCFSTSAQSLLSTLEEALQDMGHKEGA